MPTIITKKIGATNTPVTMDYTTLQAWEDAITLDLVTADEQWIGEAYDQGTFTAVLSIGGQTTDATRNIILRTAAGAGFWQKAAVRSTALDYYSGGAGVSMDIASSAAAAIDLNTAYTTIEGFQAKNRGSYQRAFFSTSSATGSVISKCIFESTHTSIAAIVSANASILLAWKNCLLIGAHAAEGGGGLGGSGTFTYCTFAQRGGGVSGSWATLSSYDRVVLKNCAVFGFAEIALGANALNAASTNNATDLGAGDGGSNWTTSLTYSSQFINIANDFRAAGSGGLQVGVTDATVTDDITGTARGATPWVGVWEVVTLRRFLLVRP